MKEILQIPLPGGSGQARTGAVHFQDDWPGIFIRGDDAIALLQEIRAMQRALRARKVPFIDFKREEVAEVIERDVIVRSGEQ